MVVVTLLIGLTFWPITLTVVAANLLGDGLTAALGPGRRERPAGRWDAS